MNCEKTEVPRNAINLARNHLPIIQEANKIFYENFKIFLLTFRRFYLNGKMLYLFGQPEWLETCFEKCYMTSPSFIKRWKEISNQPNYQFIFPEFSQDTEDAVYLNLFENGLWHGSIIYKNRNSCLDAYCFITECNNSQIRELYYNHSDIFESFINYLMEKLTPTLQNRSMTHLITFDLPQEKEESQIEKKIRIFKKELNIQKHYIMLNGQDILLSHQEYQCVELLRQGLTQKQIASILVISPRTVETYLGRIREKASIKYNSDIILACQIQNLHFKK